MLITLVESCMEHISSDFVRLLRLVGRRVRYDEALVELAVTDQGWRFVVYMDFRQRQWHHVRRYDVRLQPTDMCGWSFLVEFSDGDGEDVGRRYNCFVAADQAPDFCDCLGSLSRDYCVHRSVLRWAVEQGLLGLERSSQSSKIVASDIAWRDDSADTDTSSERGHRHR